MSAEQLSPKCSPVTEIVNVHKHDLSLAFARIVSRWLVVPREIQTARLIHSVSHIYLYIFLSVRYCISMFSVCVCVCIGACMSTRKVIPPNYGALQHEI